MIDQWLDCFHEAWRAHNINAAMDLLTDDVEYWETPYKQVHGKASISKEWQAILNQEDIVVEWKIFNSSPDNRHAVIWELSYKEGNMTHYSAGVYLIQLNESGLCDYFYYVGEEA